MTGLGILWGQHHSTQRYDRTIAKPLQWESLWSSESLCQNSRALIALSMDHFVVRIGVCFTECIGYDQMKPCEFGQRRLIPGRCKPSRVAALGIAAPIR